MAALENGRLVVNVVYTGPPLAGKTQSMKALMPLLEGRGAAQPVLSPGDWQGRTAFFDWAVYEGGAYDGNPIQCRIISTPGQVALISRREMLVRSADAVILVVDSRPEALERAVHSYEEMAPWLAEAGRDAPISLVLQCNKQDLPGSLPPDEVTRRLVVPCGKDVYATAASTGKGLRAAFVAGVRNAVERARALVARGLVLGTPEIASGEELLERLRREPVPVGPLGPAPAAAPESSMPATSRPGATSRAASAGGAAESARTSSARVSGRLSSARPASPRSAAGKDARGSSSPRFPFGADPARDARGKPKPSSGLYPTSRARAAGSPERPSVEKPARHPQHPFASSSPPASTRRSVPGAASRAAPAGAASSRAIFPACSEPAPPRDARARPAAPRRGGLNPAGEAARAWRPELGTPRPAVMPASAYHAARAEAPSAPDATTPDPGASAGSGPARAAGLAATERRAPMDAEKADSEAAPGSPAAPGSERPARPAVMPASSYFAALAARGAIPAPADQLSVADSREPSAAPAATTLPNEDEIDSGWPESAAALDAGAASGAAAEPVSTERPGEPAFHVASEQHTGRSEFADPATFGLESSRVIESPSSASEEPGESFRIPETGLHAFVAQPRPGTPPPPPMDAGSGGHALSSLAPELPVAEATHGASAGEPHDALAFAGPRMPGHAGRPRAVWRRPAWRALETHITSDGTALEDARGRWIGELAPGWYARTLRSAPDARSARRAFAEEVLRERRLREYLSRPRCVALTEEADRFWVWQIACRVPTLAAILGRRLAARESPSAMAQALLEASLGFLDARQRFVEARVPLPLSLHALSVQDEKIVYSGLLPDPGAVFSDPPADGHAAFEDALRKKWPGAPVDAAAVLGELRGQSAGRLPEPLLEIIRSVVERHSIEASTREESR